MNQIIQIVNTNNANKEVVVSVTIFTIKIIIYICYIQDSLFNLSKDL